VDEAIGGFVTGVTKRNETATKPSTSCCAEQTDER